MRVSFVKEGTGQVIHLDRLIEETSIDLYGERSLDALLDAIGNSKYVLLGEASHGTHEYYTWRAKISKRLIEEKGFSFIAVEGDWPDCYRLNRYIKNYNDVPPNATEALAEFNRWPTWMWANWEMVALAEWLRKYNEDKPRNRRIGFYGLDVYSLWESLDTIVRYLDKHDVQTKEFAIQAIKCFEPYNEKEGEAYARATQHALVPASCESEVIELLMTIRKKMQHYNTDPEATLNIEQNATVAVNAERYYRAMLQGGVETWNIRDRHMMDTLNRLVQYHGAHAKAIVWEHNTHVGDARATDMCTSGMVNIGQLVNEQHITDGVYAVGFGSYQGKVIAGSYWGDVMRVMHMPRAQSSSWEFILHAFGAKDRIVLMDDHMRLLWGDRKIGHRAIGVVYNPHWEYGNYVPSVIPSRYDAFIFIDQTSPLHPLHIEPDGRQIPETFPFGI